VLDGRFARQQVGALARYGGRRLDASVTYKFVAFPDECHLQMEGDDRSLFAPVWFRVDDPIRPDLQLAHAVRQAPEAGRERSSLRLRRHLPML
jgi:hypothetical protein